MENFLQSILPSLAEISMTFVLRLIGAVLILIVGFKLSSVFSKMFLKSKKFEKIDHGARTFIGSFLSVFIKIVVVLIVAAAIGVPTASMIALLGSAGLAIGLALQGGLSNIAGGLIIITMKPFIAGDFIQSGDISGTVDSINLFYTYIITPDNKKITVPNGTLSNATVVDFSACKTRRVDFEFSVSYSSDIDRVKKLLFDTVSADTRVEKDPAPFVSVSKHADSAIVFVVRVWCKTEIYWDVYFDTMTSVKKAFDRENIEIPFPQLDVHTK